MTTTRIIRIQPEAAHDEDEVITVSLIDDCVIRIGQGRDAVFLAIGELPLLESACKGLIRSARSEWQRKHDAVQRPGSAEWFAEWQNQ